MNKILHYIYMSLMILVVASCTDDIAESSQAKDDGNMTLLSGRMSTVDLKSVNTRAIDGQSGLGANTMIVFCFDKDGSFLGYKQVDFEETNNTPDDVDTQVYTFKVNVPSATCRVHFVANQNMTTFNASIGDNERTVMGSLESTSGSLTYWARVAVNDDGSLADGINNKTIPLVRNQAKVRLSGEGAEGVSFVVCNSYLSGRTVPFNASASTDEDPYGYTTDSPFITLSGVTAKTSPKGTTAEEEQYIFENDNDAEDPVFVILEKNDRFYKVLLADAESNMLPIYRNFQYTINIVAGALESLSGSESFQKALEADPCNNPWLYASDKLLKVSDGNLTMEIKDLDNTTVIYHNSGTYTINYRLSVKEGEIPTPTVTWTTEGTGFGQMTHSITNNGEGTVTLAISTQLNEGSNTVYRGTIMIKAGRLTRRIKVLYCNKFKFEPVWISTGVANKADQPVVMMFTVPDEFPEELLPIKCYISTNMLDANGLTPLDIETGVDIDESCNRDNSNNFYAYYTNVATKGVQRVYFWTRDIPDAVSDDVVCLSADHFEHVEKTMYFDTDKEEDEGTIELVVTVPENSEMVWIPEEINGCAFQYSRDAGTSGDEYTPINYWLLPRKQNSKYALRFRLKDGNEYTNNSDVKLRIYTEHLKPDGNDQGLETPQNAAEGGGRYYSYITNTAQLKDGSDGKYFEIRFLAPVNCTEVVRIAQEPVDGEHIHYRSVPLEMANFRAFEFNPEDANLGYDLVSDGERNYVKMAADYGPNNKVGIKFNVSPFRSVQHITDNQGAESGQLTVKADPGDDFNIYIKTKNLVPDTSSGNDVVSQENGIYKFHYKTGSHATDPINGGTLENPGGGNITLPFMTRSGYAVSEETIEIYTSTDEIDYTPLRIDLGNNPMTGSIKFGKEEEEPVAVPQDAFLVIMRRDGTRIGRFTMTGEGQYSIQLYSEYNVMWDETVYITYESGDTTYWDSGYLSTLLTEGDKTGITLTDKEVAD